jgi:hypothetical protein
MEGGGGQTYSSSIQGCTVVAKPFVFFVDRIFEIDYLLIFEKNEILENDILKIDNLKIGFSEIELLKNDIF